MERTTCPHYTNSIRYPRRIAFYDSRHGISFQDAEIRIRRIARWLAVLGTKDGDRIGVLSQNSIDYAIGVYAISRIGASMVALNLRLTEKDWKQQLELSQCGMILSDADHYARAKTLGLPVYVFEDGSQTSGNSKAGKIRRSISEKITLDKEWIARLTLNGQELVARTLSPYHAPFTIESAEQKRPQRTNRGVKRLLLRLPNAEGNVCVAILLSPVWKKGYISSVQFRPLAEW